jgi:dCTP deaminase
MSVLTGPEIEKRVECGDILIDPYDRRQRNPNSYDVRIGNCLAYYADGTNPNFPDEVFLDVRQQNPAHTLYMGEGGFVLSPGRLYLASTIERVGSDKFQPHIEGKSSLGRLGLKVHITAGWFDLGFKNPVTLEIEVIHRLRIYPGMRIAQIAFSTVEGEIELYKGKYKDPNYEPVTSKSWQDYSPGNEDKR